MPKITETYPLAGLHLEATPDEKTVVVAMPSGREKVLATVEIDELTRRIRSSVSGIPIPVFGAGPRNQINIKPLGAAAISGTATVTRHASMVLPFGWKAYKARVYNAHTAPITYGVGVTTQGAIGDAIYNGATWEVPTFSGATTVAVPAGSGTVPDQKFGTVDSDIMYTPSADYNGGTILAVRSYCATASNTRFDVSSGFLGLLSGSGLYSAYVTTGDAISTPGNFTSPTAHASAPPVEIIGYSDDAIKRIALFGSSTLSGSQDTASHGWAWRAQNAMSSDTKAYCFVNHAQPSSLTSSNITRALIALSAGAFDEAVFSVYSTNDPDRATAAGMNRLKGQMRVFIDECCRLGIKPVLATFQQPTGMTGQDFINCKEINDEARALAANGWCGLFDIAGLFNDESAAVGTWKAPANTTDGTHPNALGTVALAAYAASVFA